MKQPRFYGIAAALFYATVSISITFFNKSVLTQYKFEYHNLMTLAQMTMSLVLLNIIKYSGAAEVPNFDWATAKRISPLAISFSGMVLTGLAALKYLNIPMYSALRRITTLVAMYSEMAILGTETSQIIQLSVWVQMIGAFVAGLTDLDFSLRGYVLVAFNCLTTAAYLIYIKKFGVKQQAGNEFGLMFYNNVLSWPVVFLICLWEGEFVQVHSFPFLYDPTFLMAFISMTIQAFLLNYAIFLCTNLNSPLTTSVTGQMKNILVSAVGYVAFGDVTYSFWNVTGLLVGMVGSIWYGYLTYKRAQKPKKEEPLLPRTKG